MSENNPFRGLNVYDFWLPVEAFRGYIFTDMKPRKFEALAR